MRFVLLVLGLVVVLLLVGLLMDRRSRRRSGGPTRHDTTAGMLRVRGDAESGGAGGGESGTAGASPRGRDPT